MTVTAADAIAPASATVLFGKRNKRMQRDCQAFLERTCGVPFPSARPDSLKRPRRLFAFFDGDGTSLRSSSWLSVGPQGEEFSSSAFFSSAGSSTL
jgi:hypothetical protein